MSRRRSRIKDFSPYTFSDLTTQRCEDGDSPTLHGKYRGPAKEQKGASQAGGQETPPAPCEHGAVMAGPRIQCTRSENQHDLRGAPPFLGLLAIWSLLPR